ncbi:proteophosphoglycan ppg4 [Strigomonas culicis]|uniref:Proteophosphoglycan ppg4 n=1 Tax=Strigomonas culicis TaxID=28005 RepID=S9UN66_9TRYP|nr:proteophosphoglycan ppg4 [Strigomonas culicis]|eukprot:EPY16101.1 proteophosphoglycan ppg4 [Strigomonas culicis]
MYTTNDATMAYAALTQRQQPTDTAELFAEYFAVCRAYSDTPVARETHQRFIAQVDALRSVFKTQTRKNSISTRRVVHNHLNSSNPNPVGTSPPSAPAPPSLSAMSNRKAKKDVLASGGTASLPDPSRLSAGVPTPLLTSPMGTSRTDSTPPTGPSFNDDVSEMEGKSNGSSGRVSPTHGVRKLGAEAAPPAPAAARRRPRPAPGRPPTSFCGMSGTRSTTTSSSTRRGMSSPTPSRTTLSRPSWCGSRTTRAARMSGGSWCGSATAAATTRHTACACCAGTPRGRCAATSTRPMRCSTPPCPPSIRRSRWGWRCSASRCSVSHWRPSADPGGTGNRCTLRGTPSAACVPPCACCAPTRRPSSAPARRAAVAGPAAAPPARMPCCCVAAVATTSTPAP